MEPILNHSPAKVGLKPSTIIVLHFLIIILNQSPAKVGKYCTIQTAKRSQRIKALKKDSK